MKIRKAKLDQLVKYRKQHPERVKSGYVKNFLKRGAPRWKRSS
jgi:hypothetical protein